ncbi:ribose-5-phosphate isomerase [Magnetococcus marinus MC-1]|uniref:Ribose-5-phosphate isomerase n=1 Tax=Magnetococcus marinus (strain ATCC BAA-1437 / JCM 17883 / MC-1) TaxID=156889 RepID=A0L404_MAGMM|nr:ribose 5-phosphate isomerase B [Magnetococcus marinus]ABK42697.1 ribose-5-phosphate isomerase [Magnetococcus marinus MC-1]
MRIFFACDHGASELKQHLMAYLAKRDRVELVDLGCDGTTSVDYPDYAATLCKAVLASAGDRGVLLCGTGIGISIAANRFAGIRAALCHDAYTARLCREHNDANVLVLGGRTTGPAVAEEMLDLWLDTPYAGGRHQRRLDKIESNAREV